MEEVKGIPLSGQGRPLPPDFPYKGEWLLANRIFLYRPDAPTRSEVQMSVFLNYGRDDWMLGLDATQLADGFGIDADVLFEHNRAHTLYLIDADDVAPSRGGLRAKRYIFQIGDRQIPIFLEAGLATGRT